jgi:hypothetical protein
VKNATNGHRSGSLLAHATTRAKKHDLPITITRAWILERLDAGTCEATGLPFDTRPNEEGGGWVRRSFCPSLDRIDPAQGYTPENTQVVCWIYNAAKGTNGHEDVLILAEALCRK